MAESVFSSYGRESSPRPWGVAVGGSLAVYLVALGSVVAMWAVHPPLPVEKQVELTFIENIPKPEPPAPPPAAPMALPAAPAPAPAAAPVVPPQLKVRRLTKPPPPKELVAPREVPKAPPKEADPSTDPGVAVFGESPPADPAGLEGGSSQGIAGGDVGVIELPAGASPAVPLAGNAQPRYPRQARRSGKPGLVVLKFVILADGKVSDIQVQEGEEPFVGAALAAVRNWRYRPARHQGVAIAVYRQARIEFKFDE